MIIHVILWEGKTEGPTIRKCSHTGKKNTDRAESENVMKVGSQATSHVSASKNLMNDFR
jgi:hypothetical protein